VLCENVVYLIYVQDGMLNSGLLAEFAKVIIKDFILIYYSWSD